MGSKGGNSDKSRSEGYTKTDRENVGMGSTTLPYELDGPIDANPLPFEMLA